MMGEERMSEALATLERAIEADQEYWEAYYQRGRALGLTDRYDEALADLLRAGQLNPGHGPTHAAAFLAAYRLEDYPIAWDQAIRASLAGQNMNDFFMELYQRSEVPEDFELRIQAKKVFVADPRIDEIEARAELPFNRNPESGGIGTISGRPDYVMGSDRVKESAADIMRVHRFLREALSEAARFGVVLQPEWADYVLIISIDEIGEQPPRYLNGYLRLYERNNDDPIYYRTISLRDISTETILHGEISRFINDLEKWQAERIGEAQHP